MTWEGKDATTITLGYLCSDESPTLSGTLYNDGCICHPCHNTVTTHEVGFVGIRLSHELRQQTTLMKHLCCRITMTVRIDLVESVSQDAYCRITIGKCLAMGIDINTVCQTTDHQHLRAMTVQIL